MLIAVCFMALMVRIYYINFSSFSEVGKNHGFRTVDVGTTRGKIYDVNLKRLVDTSSRRVAVVTPAIGSSEYLSPFISSDILLEKIEAGYPFTVETEDEINNEFIRTFDVPVRYGEDSLAPHLIGYLDSDGVSGVSGIEKGYDEYLKENSGSLTVSFEIDALGRVLAGMDKYINDNNFNSSAGLVLTLDRDIQKITESELEDSNIKSGAAVVLKADSGEITAMASVPDFDANNIAQYLNAKNSPLINKALESYCAGSVIKPLILASAIEGGTDTAKKYKCTGSIRIGDTIFNCHNKKAHGIVSAAEALQKSCNTYFINLAMQLDKDYLLELLKKAGLGQADTIASGIISSSGTLPSADSLLLKGNLSNLAFGQGELTVTPLQMAKVYHVLATGNYVEPYLVSGYMDKQGIVTRNDGKASRKVLSDETVIKLREMLRSVIEKGNAQNAGSSMTSLAGKTGTAQSGIYENSKEICRTWFCGFFPYDNPRYIVIVMNENGSSGSYDCAPVFKKICEGIINCKS